MRPHGTGQDVLGQGARVVRAEQLEVADDVVERHVQQRLVQLALLELGGRPTRPGRLTDPSDVLSRVSCHEVEPGGDDPGGVPADLHHVEELHAAGVLAERRGQRLRPVRELGDQDRLVVSEALGDERDDLLDQVVEPPVEDRGVVEAGQRRTLGQA